MNEPNVQSAMLKKNYMGNKLGHDKKNTCLEKCMAGLIIW